MTGAEIVELMRNLPPVDKQPLVPEVNEFGDPVYRHYPNDGGYPVNPDFYEAIRQLDGGWCEEEIGLRLDSHLVAFANEMENLS